MKKMLEAIEKQEFSVREYVLIGLSLFLSGLAIGMFFSPKGKRTVGSYNGNNNIGTVDSDDLEKIDQGLEGERE